ncbi:hypothetical protein AOLI_G00275260 [Acnodon oligacanthus]
MHGHDLSETQEAWLCRCLMQRIMPKSPVAPLIRPRNKTDCFLLQWTVNSTAEAAHGENGQKLSLERLMLVGSMLPACCIDNYTQSVKLGCGEAS